MDSKVAEEGGVEHVEELVVVGQTYLFATKAQRRAMRAGAMAIFPFPRFALWEW